MPLDRSQIVDVDLPPLIDHTLLDPSATPEQITRLCAEAERYKFATVCIAPCHVRQAKELLNGKLPKVCTVIGFPMGANTSAVKLYEAQDATENGADELDLVLNQSWLKQCKSNELHREIAEIAESSDRLIKVILETSRLTPPEMQLAAEICLDSGVHFLKTSTGWFGGATVEDVKFLHSITKGQIGIKASGGIKTIEQAIALIQAGATRLGTSRSIDLLQQLEHWEG